MLKIVKTDATSDRGLRNVIDGEVDLLLGFDFNLNGKLGTTLYAPFTAVIDRAAGTLTINVPAFVPLNMITAAGGATHFKFNATGAEIDFENENLRGRCTVKRRVTDRRKSHCSH
jgi:hypothetical protein